jgi:hypothetical protein
LSAIVIVLSPAGASHVVVSPAATFFVTKPVNETPSTELEPISVGELSVSLPAPTMLSKPVNESPSTLPAWVPVIVQFDAPVVTCAPSAGVPLHPVTPVKDEVVPEVLPEYEHVPAPAMTNAPLVPKSDVEATFSVV